MSSRCRSIGRTIDSKSTYRARTCAIKLKVSETYLKYVKKVLGNEFYIHAMSMPLVKEAIDTAAELKLSIRTANEECSYYDGGGIVTVGTAISMWKQLTAFVHEVEHAKQGLTYEQETQTLKNGGIGALVKYRINLEYPCYEKEFEVFAVIPKELRDDNYTETDNNFKNHELKVFVNKIVKVTPARIHYSHYYYRNIKKHCDMIGIELDKRGRYISGAER